MMALRCAHDRRDDVPDQLVLTACAEWRLARLRAQLIWAENDRASLFCAAKDRDDARTSAEELARMREFEDQLAELRPYTFRGAEQMLGVAAEILAHASYRPDESLAIGPLLAIVVNVRDALEQHLDGGARLVPER